VLWPQSPIPIPMQSVGPGSVDKPLIDMATPQAERPAHSQGGKRLTDAFESMPANKRSRLSVASALNDTGNLLNEDDGTDSLLNADEVGLELVSVPQCATFASC
jgi:hypothetical protein